MPILMLWSAPRSRSTAFYRMMIERGDVTGVHEPFSPVEVFGTADIGIINASNALLNVAGMLDNRNKSLTLQTPGWQLTTGTILGGTVSIP